MNLSNDLREFVELLNSTGVKYLLVGGHATGRAQDLADLKRIEGESA